MSDINVMAEEPAGGGAMEPQSGSYGDGVAADELDASLSPMGGGPAPGPGGPPASPGPPMAPGVGGGGMAPDDLPAALLAPTRQPGVPTQTPFGGQQVNPVAEARTAAQKRLTLLDTLANSDQVSPETREWASERLSQLAGRSTG